MKTQRFDRGYAPAPVAAEEEANGLAHESQLKKEGHLMTTRILLITMLCLISVTVYAGGSRAQTHVSIQGTEISCPADPAPCPIGGTYSGFTIANNNGTAQVTATDAPLDSLKLENALITATGNMTNGSIVFWRDFSATDNDPSAPPRPIVRFQRAAQGALVRGTGAPYNPPTSAPYASLTTYGWVNGTAILPSPQMKKVMCSPAACGSFSLNSNYQDWGSLTGSRELKGEASFYLPLSGDQVKVTRVEVYNLQTGGRLNQELEELGVCGGEQCYQDLKKCQCPERRPERRK